MYAPNSNGIIGDTVRAASPELAYQIGQYFKENKLKNEIDGGNRPEEQSANHLLAHAILGAAVSYATGNNITTGALSGAGSEVAAPALSDFLFNTKDPKELTQEQKDTIVSILNLATVATNTVVNNGDINSDQMANDLNVGENAVEWNGFNKNKKEPESLRVKKERYRKAVDTIVKDTSVEFSAAAWYGGSIGATYAGDGKMNVNAAFINGGWALETAAYKTVSLPGTTAKQDGVYIETCASGGKWLTAGGCVGSNGSNNPFYSHGKFGTGVGFKYGSSIGYSQTFDFSRKEDKKEK
ncbi:hypothetical protein [Moraxella nonliquefaciens]|uniref:Toxin CdiA n=1 Tax=Moraxella nonliquefaciens TaxID=478 RepID=A0A1B8QMV6_MORNO|nr:hypothetical protein [Moraxella nonliquefaciens]OBX85313.1 hypothetical protein A7456_10355 [Moraxella nonliquefaciens]QPT44891.1 hypothetical protein I6G26_02290 [Moraxella nonliquefaciens]QQC29913.1 hypothetical protein I6H63_01025 [Moraxella nonliquefaciens]